MPRNVYQDDFQQQATRYVVHVPVTGHVLCTGWVYPIVQLTEDEWPTRRSCRTAEFNTIEEEWGGKRFPFPYYGTYIAFADSYHDGVRHRIETRFRVLGDPNQ
jgi:hypothetical protein